MEPGGGLGPAARAGSGRRAGRRVRVLVVDDSPVARDLIARGLAMDGEIEVVGQASDVYEARDAIVGLRPEVVTLDVEMPGMDGIEFLKRLMPQFPVSVVVVSAVTGDGSRRALEALEAGAADVVAKPRAADRNGLATMLLDIREKVRAAAEVDPRKLARQAAEARARARVERAAKVRPAADAAREAAGPLIGIGASTGGTAAIEKVLSLFPADCPPTLIVQHMPPVFTRMFAETMDKSVAPEVSEASDGARPRRGLVLVAPGDLHLSLERDARGLIVRCRGGEKVSGHRPSIDVLFKSMAREAGKRTAAMLLTGMGRDGAAGLLELRRSGGRCLAQDEESSVVFGMPAEAWSIGAAERLVPIDHAAGEILALAASVGSER